MCNCIVNFIHIFVILLSKVIHQIGTRNHVLRGLLKPRGKPYSSSYAKFWLNIVPAFALLRLLFLHSYPARVGGCIDFVIKPFYLQNFVITAFKTICCCKMVNSCFLQGTEKSTIVFFFSFSFFFALRVLSLGSWYSKIFKEKKEGIVCETPSRKTVIEFKISTDESNPLPEVLPKATLFPLLSVQLLLVY